jgi:hypothetical protein
MVVKRTAMDKQLRVFFAMFLLVLKGLYVLVCNHQPYEVIPSTIQRVNIECKVISAHTLGPHKVDKRYLVTFFLSTPTSHSIRNTQWVQDDYQIQVVSIVTCFISFEVHLNFPFTVKMRILMLILNMYRSPPIMLTTELRMVNILWARSHKYILHWCPFLDPHLTTYH